MTEQIAEQTTEVKDVAQEADKTWYWPVLIGLITAILVCAAMVGAYHYYVVVPSKQRIATVDVQEILDVKQLQMTKALLQKDLDDSGRAKIYDDIKEFTGTLEQTISDIQRECACTLLVRAAVVKGDAPDLTGAVKSRLGMTGLDPVAMAKELGKSGPQNLNELTLPGSAK